LQRGEDPPPVVTTCGDFVFGEEQKEKKITRRRRERRDSRRKRRKFEASDRKSPPFPPEAGEGWGTLKPRGGQRLRGKTEKRKAPASESGRYKDEPRSKAMSDCATEKRNPRPRHRLRAWGNLRLG
jgi:hypothetical protein